MTLLGWLSDTHIEADATSDDPGPTNQLPTDFNKLVSMGVDDVYFNGDLVHPDESGEVPHVPQGAYDRFWSLIDGTSDPDKFRAANPGNHDIPVQRFLRSDDRAVLRGRWDYDDDGVSVFMINTQATGFASGSPGLRSGIGETSPRCSRRDLDWLDRQLDDAGSNAKIIFAHALLNPKIIDAEFNGLAEENNTYEYVKNWGYAQSILEKHNKVVVPQGHVYTFDGAADEFSVTINGVDYLHTQHYYDEGNDSATTFGYIDVTDSSITATAEEHSDGTTYTLLDKTF